MMKELINSIISDKNDAKEFYNKYESINKTKIYVGISACGVIAGASETLKKIEHYKEENILDYDIIQTGCKGLCWAEPIVDIQIPGRNRLVFEKVSSSKVNELLDAVLNNHIPQDMLVGQYISGKYPPWDGVNDIYAHPYLQKQNKIITENCGIIDPTNIEDYIAKGGYIPFVKTIGTYTASELCDIIEKSGLRGRGGGGFPTAKKWKISLNEAANNKYVICNADESDPGAFMDRNLIEGNPHQIIEGLAFAAYAIGADTAFIYIRSEYKIAVARIRKALEDAYEYGILGSNIFNSGYNLNIKIKLGSGAFVCGEETALINSIEGKRATPETKPPYPSTCGYKGMPTVVNNVETLANVPLIMKNGPQWYSKLGTTESKGTKIFSLTGKISRSGLVEVEMGTTFNDIISDIGGGIKDANYFKAFQIGGPSGNISDESNLQTPISFESLKEAGLDMGSGGLVVMDNYTCIVDIVKYSMNFLSQQSCGKCIPCREGTGRLYEILKNISSKTPTNSKHLALDRFKGIMKMEKLAMVMKETSLCGLGKTAADPILSSLKYFRAEYEEHIFEKECKAGVCSNLKTYYIIVENCVGCNSCQKRCPENAIIGTIRQPHFIIEEKCKSCNLCYEVCKFNAIQIK